MGKLYMEEKINECICVSDEQPKLKNCLDDHRIELCLFHKDPLILT